MANWKVQWEAPEYEYHDKDVSWYWTSIIVAAAIVAFAVWQRNFLFGLFIVVAEILFIIWGNRPPRNARFTADQDGISVTGAGEKLHLYKEFESMGVNPIGEGWSELVFIFRARFKTPLKTLIPNAELANLRANLKTVLREIPYEPTLLDSIEKLLRF